MGTENKKALIVSIFVEMVKTMPVEAIRVNDLIEKSGVSRATFYRLFPDKYSVMSHACLTVIEPVVAEFPELPCWSDWSHAFLEHIRENKAYYRNIVSYKGQNSFYDFMYSYFLRNSKTYISQKCGARGLTAEISFALEAFANLGAFAVNRWIENRCDLEIDTLIQYIESCIPDCIKGYYEE